MAAGRTGEAWGRRRFVLAAAGLLWFALILYAALAPFVPRDAHMSLLPWYRHILAAGPVAAFAEPFGNYTPTYLYLLALVSLLDPWLSPIVAIKLLAAAGNLLLAGAMWRLLKALEVRHALMFAAAALVLPTMVLNGPVLAQCDALWTGACLMALAMAAERRSAAMLVWCGVAGAFKLQAIFFAPFALLMLWRLRAPLWQLLIPLGVYALFMAPAWLAGWPAADLATIYPRQAAWGPNFVGNAANAWALPAFVAGKSVLPWLPIGLVAAAIATAFYLWRLRNLTLTRDSLLAAALLSSLMLPFLLPRMHERYFFLADLLALAFAAALRSRLAVAVALLVQAGSLLALTGYWEFQPALTVAGSAAILAAILLILRTLRSSTP